MTIASTGYSGLRVHVENVCDTFAPRIFDEATSCCHRSQDLLDRITISAATLEGMLKSSYYHVMLTDYFVVQGPVPDVDPLLQGLKNDCHGV